MNTDDNRAKPGLPNPYLTGWNDARSLCSAIARAKAHAHVKTEHDARIFNLACEAIAADIDALEPSTGKELGGRE